MRLARVEVLSRGSTSVGCRFYAVQGIALTQSEHLPGPNQPALEIVSTPYANETAARNAAVAIATAGTNQQVVTLTGGVAADLFQAAFDPVDGTSDWQVVFNKGATLVTIKTAVADNSLDAVNVANSIVAAV
jgi:fructose-1,6-bisphosphatase